MPSTVSLIVKNTRDNMFKQTQQLLTTITTKPQPLVAYGLKQMWDRDTNKFENTAPLYQVLETKKTDELLLLQATNGF